MQVKIASLSIFETVHNFLSLNTRTASAGLFRMKLCLFSIKSYLLLIINLFLLKDCQERGPRINLGSPQV